MERERRGRDYWREQLSEYWDGGLTIQEYCELKDLPYESVRRWIGILKKEREGNSPASGVGVCRSSFADRRSPERFRQRNKPSRRRF